jgi:hypothetical protein
MLSVWNGYGNAGAGASLPRFLDPFRSSRRQGFAGLHVRLQSYARPKAGRQRLWSVPNHTATGALMGLHLAPYTTAP